MALTAIQLTNEVYLLSKADNLAEFTLDIIAAKIDNLASCKRHEIPLEAGAFQVTPNEELFLKFYNAKKLLVKDMSTLDLRAHREELEEIAFQARAESKAAADELDEREKKRSPRRGLDPFNNGDYSSDAINSIQGRKKKLNKMEKLREQLKEWGVPQEDVEKIMSARGIRDSVNEGKVAPRAKGTIAKPNIAIPIIIEESRPVKLPSFGKPATEQPAIEQPVIETEETKTIRNPFAK